MRPFCPRARSDALLFNACSRLQPIVERIATLQMSLHVETVPGEDRTSPPLAPPPRSPPACVPDHDLTGGSAAPLLPTFTWHGFQHVLVSVMGGASFDGQLHSIIAHWTTAQLESASELSFAPDGGERRGAPCNPTARWDPTAHPMGPHSPPYGTVWDPIVHRMGPPPTPHGTPPPTTWRPY